MNADNEFPTIGMMVVGYFLSAGAAVVTAAFIFCAGLPKSTNVFAIFLMVGLPYIVILGLPGFAATVFMSRRWLIRHWLYFTLAGGLNAIFAWLLVGGITLPFMDLGGRLMIASMAGGVVGGLAYWFVAEWPPRGPPAIVSE